MVSNWRCVVVAGEFRVKRAFLTNAVVPAIVMSLFVMLGVATSPGAAYADEVFGDYTYVAEDDSVSISGYTGNDAAVSIPAEIDGKPVVQVRSRTSTALRR